MVPLWGRCSNSGMELERGMIREVTAAVVAYDGALRRDDLDAVGRWFVPAATTRRFGESGAVCGADAIDGDLLRKFRLV